jgi:AraC family transcriptional regulator
MQTDSPHIVEHASGVLGGLSDAPVRAGPYAVTLTRLPTRLRLPPHFHRQATLNVVLDGEYSETIGRGSARTFGPATMIAKPAGTVHSNQVGTASVECLVIEVPDESLSGSDVLARRSAMIAKAGGRLRAELARRDDITPLVVEALVLELLGELGEEAPPPGSSRRWLDRVRDLLHDEPGPRALADLAREVGRHPIYLARAFRARFGTSVGEYARCLRVERARRLLHHRSLSLSEVAARAGYSDQSHLTRDFRRSFGQSPGSYRKLIRRVP